MCVCVCVRIRVNIPIRNVPKHQTIAGARPASLTSQLTTYTKHLYGGNHL